MESVILGDSAYQVQQGFLADANALRRAAAASQPAPDPKPVPAPAAAAKAAPVSVVAPAPKATAPALTPAQEKAGEQDLLAQFLLENLN